ncbi:Dxr 1-deoxy-D-xylulose 5-phosphate reductoisomerase [Burkholderiaceae bacterium]|jgi:1-deoxy-D-xylulose-5-phosphate reductoisomerase
MTQQLTILGSTGSIGVNTLDVVARHPEKFQIFALTGARQVELMFSQCLAFKPQFAVMVEREAAQQLAEKIKSAGLSTQVFNTPQALVDVSSDERVDVVMAAIVGAAGLAPCLAAAKTGKRLLLANKEALVVGGQLFLDTVLAGGAKLLPIDSEHSAVFQSLPDNPEVWPAAVDKIILTASGGPFRTRDPNSLHTVTPEEACAHPNWVMGRKISVDSATMMNKALEVIEAKYLFGVTPRQIEVVIHPQSVIHSMVQFVDGSVVAQLGTPDMRMPIAYGLSWPDRITSGSDPLNFNHMQAMTFEAMDEPSHMQRFPGLRLAWEALAAPQGTTAVLNAANEVAVDLFLKKQIRFDHIHQVNLATLERIRPMRPQCLEDLLDIDAQARDAALAIAANLQGGAS